MVLENLWFIIAASIFAVAYVLYGYPEIVLKVPNFGHVLYHYVSGAPIPPYQVEYQWKNDSAWLHSGDVVVASWVKGGTTWAMVTAHSIRTRGVMDYDSVVDVVPWVDFVRYPGETLAERIQMFARISALYPFGVYKTHSSPSAQAIKLRADVQYIVGVRSLLDSCASLRSFLPGHTERFSSLWGGFPPRQQNFDQYEKWLLDDMGTGVGFITILTDFLRNWWPRRREPNVLLVHFADRLRDPRADIELFMEHLGVSLSDEEIQAVINVSSFEFMKVNNDKYAYCLSNSSESVQQLSARLPSPLCAMESMAFVAKGAARKGEEELPPRLVARIKERCIMEFGVVICAWLESGGAPPDVDMPIRGV
jgi:aryl sulfotransferase